MQEQPLTMNHHSNVCAMNYLPVIHTLVIVREIDTIVIS